MSTIFYMLRKEWKNRLLALFRHPGKLVVYILLVVLLVNSVISTALTLLRKCGTLALVGLDCLRGLAQIAPVTLAIPAYGITIQDAMGFLAQVNDIDWPSGLLPQHFGHLPELAHGELGTAGRIQLVQPLAARDIGRVQIEPLGRRVEGGF